MINTRRENKYINQLEDWFNNGKINIVGAERFFREMNGNEINFEKAKQYQNISEPQAIGYGGIDFCKIGSKLDFGLDELRSVLFPHVKVTSYLNENQLNDLFQLLSHANDDNDYFVTNDEKDFIHSKKGIKDFKKQKMLKENFSLEVVTPKDCVDRIKKRASF